MNTANLQVSEHATGSLDRASPFGNINKLLVNGRIWGENTLKNSVLMCGTFSFQLEEVMEKETYKTAKLILERFDPESSAKVRILVLILM